MNCTTVIGNISTLDANIIGITPAGFTFSGKWLLCPPYALAPTTRFAYVIGILRNAASTYITNTIIAIAIAANNTTLK